MKLCATNRNKQYEAVSEIRYSAARIPSAIESATEDPDRTYIIEFLDMERNEVPLKKAQEIVDSFPNIVLDCYKKVDFLKLIINNKHRIMYHEPVTTWNDLQYFVYLRPYAINIGEPLSFDLANVKKLIQEVDETIQIRVTPMQGRPAGWNFMSAIAKDNGIRHFWITPQTVDYYEPYVDTLDLYDEDAGREAMLIKLYSKKECDFLLSDLVKHCEVPLPCKLVDEDFVDRRLICRQACMKSTTNQCRFCEHAAIAMLKVIAKTPIRRLEKIENI